MPMSTKVMPIFGTRPEAVKMAPVIRELTNRAEFEVVVVVTGQHREMLHQFLKFFRIEPHYDLDIMREEQTPSDITRRVLAGIEVVLRKEQPDLLLAQGDTTTTFAAVLAAFYSRIPSGHIEAGLRTWDKFNPFPEESNRRMVSALADLHFAPTLRAKENLLKENVGATEIYVTGNTVVDALNWVIQQFPATKDRSKKYKERVILATAHRRENWGDPMVRTCRALRRVIERFSDTRLIFPVHRNPAVRDIVQAELGGCERIQVTEPVGYLEFVQLMRCAHIIVTDSGGVQEEAPTLGVPVLVLRDFTERPEAVEAGVVELVGTDEERIVGTLSRVLSDGSTHEVMSNAINPYGDGHAAGRTVDAIAYYFGINADPPNEFRPVT